MFTRGGERTRGTFTYRQALCQAMRTILTAPFFRRWEVWTSDLGGKEQSGGPWSI